MAIQPQPSVITETAVKPELKNIINTDVLKVVLKDYKDKISTFKFNKFKFNKFGLNKKEIIGVAFFAILFIAMGLHNIWQSSYVKEYFFKKEVVSYLKEGLSDPDALKIVKWGKLTPVKAEDREKYTHLKDVYWEIKAVYSGKNAFGGRVSKLADFYFGSDGKVIKHYDNTILRTVFEHNVHVLRAAIRFFSTSAQKQS